MQGLRSKYGRDYPKVGGKTMDGEFLKYVLDQAGGILIALMLIMRIETKLDGLTSAVVQLSEAIKPPRG